MALAIQTKHHGIIRFYREPLRNGGDILAVFPKSPDDTPGMREALACAEGVYYEVEEAYVRSSCRPADGADEETRAVAEFVARRADEATEYARSLAANA